jgi:phage recombination protein Bet
MSNIVVAQASKLAKTLGMDDAGQELIQTLKATAFKGDATDAQMAALLVVSNQYGLNPWTREIYAFPDKKNGIVPVVGVDGWARIINNHPQFDGMEFDFSKNLVQMPGAASQAPEWIECRMYRKDRSRPIVVREYLDECYREPFKGQYGAVNGPWQSHPKRFLRHKTLIQCARMAFGFGGIYDQDEAERIAETAEPAIQPARHMGQADVVVDAPSPELIARAQAAAAQGMKAYQAFWAGVTAADRKALTNAGEHERLKAIAAKADAERTVDTAPAFPPMDEPVQQPAGKTFEQIMQMLCDAKTEDALYVAADWASSMSKEEETLLNEKFNERLAQIRGDA